MASRRWVVQGGGKRFPADRPVRQISPGAPLAGRAGAGGIHVS